MKPLFNRFLITLFIFSAIFGLLILGTSLLIPSRFVSPSLPFLFVFFIAVTILVSYILLKAWTERFSKFINTYLLVTVVKLMFFIAVIFLYISLNRADAAPFAFSFFILYLFYEVFEVAALITHSKKFQQ